MLSVTSSLILILPSEEGVISAGGRNQTVELRLRSDWLQLQQRLIANTSQRRTALTSRSTNPQKSSPPRENSTLSTARGESCLKRAEMQLFMPFVFSTWEVSEMTEQENLINIPPIALTSCDGKYIYLELKQLVHLSINREIMCNYFDNWLIVSIIFQGIHAKTFSTSIFQFVRFFFCDICDSTLNILDFFGPLVDTTVINQNTIFSCSLNFLSANSGVTVKCPLRVNTAYPNV